MSINKGSEILPQTSNCGGCGCEMFSSDAYCLRSLLRDKNNKNNVWGYKKYCMACKNKFERDEPFEDCGVLYFNPSLDLPKIPKGSIGLKRNPNGTHHCEILEHYINWHNKFGKKTKVLNTSSTLAE